MCQYKIVCLKERFSNMVEIYPDLAGLLYYQQNDIFETKQVEQIFQPIGNDKEKLLQNISQREDYSYFHGVHKISNPITDEVITIEMNEYDILVEENYENHIIFDLFKGFSKNFCMIRL